MKKTILILTLLIAAVSCSKDPDTTPYCLVIIKKEAIPENPIHCWFTTNQNFTFMDSCWRYEAGDTIDSKHAPRKQ